MHDASTPTIDLRRMPGTVTVFVTGDLDDHTSTALLAALDQVIAERPAQLAVDLGDVDHFSSAAVRVLFDARCRHRGPFRLERPSPGVRKVLRVLGLDLELNATTG